MTSHLNCLIDEGSQHMFYEDYPLLATDSPCFLELLGKYYHIFPNLFYIKIVIQDGHSVCFNSKNSIHQHVHEITCLLPIIEAGMLYK